MVVFLSITDGKGTNCGVLEVLRRPGIGGQVDQAWEWNGNPFGSDGGTWVWDLDQFFGAIVTMNLTSNVSGRQIGKLEGDWAKGLIPPHEPWFSNQFKNRELWFTYMKNRLRWSWALM